MEIMNSILVVLGLAGCMVVFGILLGGLAAAFTKNMK